MEQMPPYQYMIRLPQNSYTHSPDEYETGLAVSEPLASQVSLPEGAFALPSRICVSVLIAHDVHKIQERWENISLAEEFAAAGVYRFMDENALTLKGDIFGLTCFDTYSKEVFRHYIRYYFPVF